MHTIWSPTNIPYIQIGVDSHDGIFKIRSSEKVTSKKTGNEYNKYLDEEISIKLSKEYNITHMIGGKYE